MGFDIERFIGTVNEGLLCSICRDVLEDPLLAPCEHTFCSSCIHTWLTHYHNCPEDRQNLWPSDLKPIFRYMKNDLDALKIRCDHEVEGCKAEVALGNLKHHLEEECAFTKVSCSNKGCEEKINRCELETHLIICDFQTTKCTKGCGLQVNMNEITQHNCLSELKKRMEEQKNSFAATLHDLKTEIESRLDSQRAHMVYKESNLQNQVDELKSKMEELARDNHAMKAKEMQREEEYRVLNSESRDVIEWLKGLKYQDDLSEKYCGSCSKRYMYVRKEPLTSLTEQINTVPNSTCSTYAQDALLTSLRTTRSKPRSLCTSPVSDLVPGRSAILRTNSEESCLDRSSVEYWRRDLDPVPSYSTSTALPTNTRTLSSSST